MNFFYALKIDCIIFLIILVSLLNSILALALCGRPHLIHIVSTYEGL